MRREPTTPAVTPDVPLRSLAEFAAGMGLVGIVAEARARAHRLAAGRVLEHELRGQLRSTHEIAERALAELRRRHEEGSEAVRSELVRLAGHRRALDALRDAAPVAVTEGQ